MIDSQDDAVIIEPPEEARGSVIWLHGLGADGHDFEPIVPELGLPNTRATRFVFPHAPSQPVTINGGMVMRAWYDIRSPSLPGEPDESGIRRSESMLRDRLNTEMARGIPSDRIVLAGFSQGGVIALQTGLRFERRLAGILTLSTYLPMFEATRREAHAANESTPIFIAHGRDDPLIPIEAAKDSSDFLTALGYSLQWFEYAMPHSVCPEEIRDIAGWLSAVLA